MILRPNQVNAIRDIQEFIHSDLDNGIVVSPVATGKSIIIAETVKLFNAPTICLQPNKELLKQNYEKYTGYGFDASIYSASLKRKDVGQVTYATIGSIMSDLGSFRDIGVQNIIADEIQYGSKDGNQLAEACKFLKIKKKIGLTATPIFLRNSQEGSFLQMMSNNRESIFRNIIHVTQIQDIQQYWTPINYKYSKEGVNSLMLQLNSTGRDYTAESLKRFYDSNSIEYKILRSISWLKEKGVYQALIFVPSVAEAESIAIQIVGGEVLHGGTKPKERERIVEGFKSGEIPYVINVDVLGTGFDYPKLPAIIHGRPTNSFVTYYQHIGRVVRTHTDKKQAWFLDLVGNVQKFGKIEEFRFEQDKKGKWEMWDSEKKITHNGFKPKIISMSEILELEENIRSYLIMTGKYKNYNLIEVVKKDKRYLQWMASDKFEPMSENAQRDKESAIIALKYFNII
jgi:DNA repair protein RadD